MTQIKYTKQNVVVYRGEVGNYRIFIGPKSMSEPEGPMAVRIYGPLYGSTILCYERAIGVVNERYRGQRGYAQGNRLARRWLKDKGVIPS